MNEQSTANTVSTPIGDLVITDKNDAEYPGFYVSLRGPMVNDYFSNEQSLLLAMVEYDHNKNMLQSVMYLDGFQEEPTVVYPFRNATQESFGLPLIEAPHKPMEGTETVKTPVGKIGYYVNEGKNPGISLTLRKENGKIATLGKFEYNEDQGRLVGKVCATGRAFLYNTYGYSNATLPDLQLQVTFDVNVRQLLEKTCSRNVNDAIQSEVQKLKLVGMDIKGWNTQLSTPGKSILPLNEYISQSEIRAKEAASKSAPISEPTR